MFGKRVRLFSLLGFDVYIDASWAFIAILITWSLAVGLFPQEVAGLSPGTYWAMGALGAVGLFFSIIFHEFSHSLVARRFGLEMKGITLFLFGGIAEMHDEPETAKSEFWMAIAGPLSSLLLAAAFYGLTVVGENAGWPDTVLALVGYLSFINLVVAIFNMVPAFPLDGGRVLRSILWGWKKNLRWATRVASRMGSGFGYLLMGLGLLSVMAGNVIGGIWWFLIGMFINGASRSSRDQQMLKSALSGEPVRRFMQTEPVTVPPGVRLRELVDDYIYRYHYKTFPVVENGRLVSCISTRRIKEIPQAEWDMRSVGEVADRCDANNTVRPDADAMDALSLMNRTGSGRLLVVEDDRLVGILALKDLLDFLSLKIDLEG